MLAHGGDELIATHPVRTSVRCAYNSDVAWPAPQHPAKSPSRPALDLRAPMPDAPDLPSGWACAPASRPAFRCEGLTLMPRPHEQRPSKLRNAASRPGHEADANSGGWSCERLIAMDARYCEVMRAALDQGRAI